MTERLDLLEIAQEEPAAGAWFGLPLEPHFP